MLIKIKDLYKNYKGSNLENDSIKHYYYEFFCNNMSIDLFCKLYKIDYMTADWVINKGKELLNN